MHYQIGKSRSGVIVVDTASSHFYEKQMEGYVVNVRQAADFPMVTREYELTYDEALKRAMEGRSCIQLNPE